MRTTNHLIVHSETIYIQHCLMFNKYIFDIDFLSIESKCVRPLWTKAENMSQKARGSAEAEHREAFKIDLL